MAKAIEKLRQLLAAQRVQISLCAKRSSSQELYKIYKGLVDERNSRKFFEVRLLVLEPLMRVHNNAFIGS